MPALRTLPRPERRFLGDDFQAARPEAVIEEGRRLLVPAAPGTPAELAEWLARRHELSAAVEEERLLSLLDLVEMPADPQRRQWLAGVHQELLPVWLDLEQRLDDMLLRSPALEALPAARAEALRTPALCRRSRYRESNIFLLQRLAELESEALGILGGLRPARPADPGCGLHSPEEDHRREAWRALPDAAAPLQEWLEDLLDELLALREQVARNAGLETYAAYEAACRGQSADGEAAERRRCLSLFAGELRTLDQARAGELGRSLLRPWDRRAEAAWAPPQADLREAETLDDLQAGLQALDPNLALAFAHWRAQGRLRGRTGCGPGLAGCCWLPERALPLLVQGWRGFDGDLAGLLRFFSAGLRRQAREEAGLDTPACRVLLPLVPLDAAAAQAWLEGCGAIGTSPSAAARRPRLWQERLEIGFQSALREEWEARIEARPGLDRHGRGRLRLELLDELRPGAGLEADDALRQLLEGLLDPLLYLGEWRLAQRWTALEPGAGGALPVAQLTRAVLAGEDSGGA
jgi:hypothetical protein